METLLYTENLIEKELPIVGFTTSGKTKPQIIQWMEASFDRKTIKLIDDPIAISELHAFQANKSSSGTITYSGIPHDDTVMALAIAWYHARIQPATILSSSSGYHGSR